MVLFAFLDPFNVVSGRQSRPSTSQDLAGFGDDDSGVIGHSRSGIDWSHGGVFRFGKTPPRSPSATRPRSYRFTERMQIISCP